MELLKKYYSGFFSSMYLVSYLSKNKENSVISLIPQCL